MSTPPPPTAVARAALFWRRLLRGPRSTAREALYEELASLLQAGFGMRQAVAALEGRVGGVAELVALWSAQVERGDPISAGMLARPDLCVPEESVLMRAGERSGRLVDVLRRLAVRIGERRAAARGLVLKLAYPFLVLHVALFLPTLPAVMMPHGFVAWATVVACGLLVLWGLPFAVISLAAAYGDDPEAMRRVAGWPIVGTGVRAAATARFAATLGMLHDAGETADVALEEAAHAASGWYLTRLAAACHHVQDGGKLAEAVGLLPAAPRELRDLVATGEAAGAIAEHMARATTLFQERARGAATRCAAFAAAFAFVLAVVVVVIAIIAVLGPIYAPLFEMTR